MPSNKDTITAIATPPGRSGIGVIRVSGEKSAKIYKSLTGKNPENRYARHSIFKSTSNKLLDKGVSLFFKGPSSFTGEDVMECYTHGNRMIMETLLEEIISLGARLAMPGEFTERAFLNNKMDLVQAEAVADLIDSNSKKAARSAIQSLDGVFSENILQLKEKTINAKAFLEACLDFPDEEDVNFDIFPIQKNIKECLVLLDKILIKAKKGRALDCAPLIVIAGPTNAGKSTLINFLSGSDSAITSDLPGTTRDTIREKVFLADHLVTLVDTAGFRQTSDQLEKESIGRAYKAIKHADLVLYVTDSSLKTENIKGEIKKHLPNGVDCLFVRNKIDLCDKKIETKNIENTSCSVSAKTGAGIEELTNKIQRILDVSTEDEDVIFARQRHIDALKNIRSLLQESLLSLEKQEGLEIVAESLRESLLIFDEILGKITTDDILEKIFSRFCIGK